MKTTNQTVRVFVTKYALTDGILEYDADIVDKFNKPMARAKHNGFEKFFHGDEFHMTREAAIEKAKKMQKAKIESLKKSIKKIQEKTFE